MSDQDTLFKYYGYFAEAKWDGLKNECFHPDITWVMPGHHPLSGTMKGADAVIAFLRELYGAGVRVEDVHVGVLDNGWIVEKHMGHGEAEGTKYDFPTCTTYEFKDGKIYNVQVHNGDPIAADRFFWGRYKLKGVPDRLAK